MFLYLNWSFSKQICQLDPVSCNSDIFRIIVFVQSIVYILFASKCTSFFKCATPYLFTIPTGPSTSTQSAQTAAAAPAGPPQAAAAPPPGGPPQAAAPPPPTSPPPAGPPQAAAPPPPAGPPQAAAPPPEREYEELFHVVGSWLEERYQRTLGKVEDDMRVGTTIPTRVVFQPQNPEDINAIECDAFVDNTWKIVGNIQKQEIPKLTSALRANKITKCVFTRVPQYKINIQNSGHCGLVCWVTVTKKGKWGKNDEDYRYNKDISHL